MHNKNSTKYNKFKDFIHVDAIDTFFCRVEIL
jgi:hypothetical protein